MYIISWNINGLKSRFDEVIELIATYNPDFVCLQKVRCNNDREQFEIEGYRALYTPIDSGKWSGVITYAKIPTDSSVNYPSMAMPERIHTLELSKEGHLQVFRCKDFALVNAYVPFANDKLEGADDYRKQWDVCFRRFISELSKDTPVVICGDLNVVHTIKDTFEDRLEQNRPNFSRWERDNFNALIRDADLVDAYREEYPDEQIPTFYGNYRSSNLGNRIDYFLISRSLLPGVTACDILSHFGTGQSVPIILEFNPGVTAQPSGYRESSQGLDQKASIPNTSESETISIQDAARWLATMAATDGLVSPSERKLLKEFADTYKLDASSLYRMAHAIANQVDIPEVESVNQAEMKGRKFEEFVVKLTADKSRFTRLNWSSDKFVDGIYSLDTLMPDLHLRHRLDTGEVEYYVECKYRSSLPDGVLDLTSQLGRYRRMSSAETNSELFLAVGIGGTPSEPEQFYLIPSRMVKKDYIIRIENFGKCLCPQTPDGFHNYINHYFNKRVFKK